MKGKSFRWLVVGAGREEYEARLRLQTESLGMNRDVLMADALFPALPVYRIASVVVMPSENEAFGMVLAEASAFGVPVIASETGGIPDVIQNNVTGTLFGFAPIFPDICYHLTHYKPAAADIPVASDNPAHYADAIRYNARTPLQGSLLPLTRLVWA